MIAGEMLPGDLDDENRATFTAEQDRHYVRMQQVCRELFDDAGVYLAAFPGSWAKALIMDGISTLYGVVMSPRPRARQVALVQSLAAPLGEVAEARRIRDARRTYRAMVQASKGHRRSPAAQGGSQGDRLTTTRRGLPAGPHTVVPNYPAVSAGRNPAEPPRVLWRLRPTGETSVDRSVLVRASSGPPDPAGSAG